MSLDINNIPELQTSHSILLINNHYILQLRDNNVNIAASGQWSLFGGMKEKNEEPLKAIKREIKEELLIEPKFTFLWYTNYFAIFEQKPIRTYFFVSEVSNFWPKHKLMEGKAAVAFLFEEIKNLDMPEIMKITIEKYHKNNN